MRLGGIPWAAIEHYGTKCGIHDLDELFDFCEIIQAMDDAFLKQEAERSKIERAKPKPTRRGRR